MQSNNDGIAITLKLSVAQHQWVEKAARQLADLHGHSVAQSTVLLKLLELGLPLFEAEVRAKQEASKPRLKLKPRSSAPRTLKIVPLA